MNARTCLVLYLMIALTAFGAKGQSGENARANPTRLELSIEVATTTDDGRPSSARVELKNIGNFTVWLPVLGHECTYLSVQWTGVLGGTACGMSGTGTLTVESVRRSWVQLRPGEFMVGTVPIFPPTDQRRREFWVVYEPPATQKE